MTFLGSQSGLRQGQFFQALFAALLLTLVGTLNVNIMKLNISLSWLPLLVIALWPHGAPPIRSVIAIFFLGLAQDWLHMGVPGQWALSYLLFIFLFRPFERLRPLTFGKGLRLWVGAITIAALVLTLSGRIIFKDWPYWGAILQPALLATLAFPLFWILRNRMQSWFSRREEAL